MRDLMMKTLIVVICLVVSGVSIQAQDLTALAKKIDALSSEAVTVSTNGKTLWLVPSSEAIQAKKLSIPRLCAPLKSMGWKGHPKRELKFTPEIDHLVWTWSEATQGDVIEVELDGEPVLLSELESIQPAADGTLMLPACFAKTFGEKLRYEPQWFKNTVGYWTGPKDYAEWSVTITEPGQYAVAVLQGLGAGQGGSDAELSLRQGDIVKGEIAFEPVETGHFQNFRWVHLGIIEVSQAGEYQVRIEPRKIAKAALMDVRGVHLGKQAKGVK
jgi:hypothetical protein